MLNSAPPTDQRSGVRPISFVLDRGGALSAPVTLKVRPEDLTRNEPSRIAVHQTLGREISGWADNFGAGLPSVTIAGHTGWRSSATTGEDGVRAFESLNQLVQHDYHSAKQLAIDTGINPASIKLLFIDMLDGFTWNVAPITFVLRRSKSRPLLMQYNIQLQAVSTSVDTPFMVLPFVGNVPAGLRALSSIIAVLRSMSGSIQGWVAEAVSFKDAALRPFAATAAEFADFSTQVYTEVYTAVASVKNGISSTANSLISIASDLATVGINVFRTLAAIEGLPQHAKYNMQRVASAYTEVLCIFSNSLRPKRIYQDYDGLYGASNCSSTSGGRAPSPYANMNAFELLKEDRLPVSVNSRATAGIAGLGRHDPVLAPASIEEMDRLLKDINEGSSITTGGAQ